MSYLKFFMNFCNLVLTFSRQFQTFFVCPLDRLVWLPPLPRWACPCRRALAYIRKHFLPCPHFFPTFFPFFYPLLTYTISSPPSLPPTTISGPSFYLSICQEQIYTRFPPCGNSLFVVTLFHPWPSKYAPLTAKRPHTSYHIGK